MPLDFLVGNGFERREAGQPDAVRQGHVQGRPGHDDLRHKLQLILENVGSIRKSLRQAMEGPNTSVLGAQEVQALGEGALKGYYTNYFPHMFERPEQASKFVESFFSGKRSMEGPKSFLQHRDFPTFREALNAGLKPVSDNPVDLVMMKAREMDRYLMAHATLRDLAENGIAKRVSGLGPDARQREMLGGAPIRPEWAVEKREDLPANFVSIRDPVGGGKWFAEEGAADVLNNFLSVGLRARSGAARILLGVNNTMNQSNLALSGFHLLAETVSSVAGRAGLGFVKAMQGHPLDAAWHVAITEGGCPVEYRNGRAR